MLENTVYLQVTGQMWLYPSHNTYPAVKSEIIVLGDQISKPTLNSNKIMCNEMNNKPTSNISNKTATKKAIHFHLNSSIIVP